MPTSIKQYVYKLEAIFVGIESINELSKRALDLILGFGEIMSCAILHHYLKQQLDGVSYLKSGELIITSLKNGKEQILTDKTYAAIQQAYPKESRVAVAPGFISRSEKGYPTTLGRGGSDFTAAIFAAALNASLLEIWTDVSGIYTADPNLVESAYPLKQLSYAEALELSHFGAKVIYPPTIQPVLEKSIPIKIKNTFKPDENGTLVSKNTVDNGTVVKAFSSINDISLLTLSGNSMVGVAGIAGRLFTSLSREYINVILITQASSEHSICLAVEKNDTEKAVACIDGEFDYEITKGLVNKTVAESGFTIIAMVGEGMINTVGLSGKAFAALGRNGVNIHAIAQGSSELNVSMVINKKDSRKALNVLHETFFLSEYKTVNLFIVGVGNVGRELLNQFKKQAEFFKTEHRLILKLSGLANSRKMLFTPKGVDFSNWKNQLEEEGEVMVAEKFVQKIEELNVRNSIFIDNTASDQISNLYFRLLNSNVSVVTCNKIAASSNYSNYLLLKKTANKRNVFFRYESNVGAGLPLIKTLNNLVKSGDRIEHIEAVLSGSLNFIFNRFHQGIGFAEAVAEAMQAGYTEPDPRIDLSGKDVMRKLLILMREVGLTAEFEDINLKTFLPDGCLEVADPQKFVAKLKEMEPYFNDLREKAESENKRLRFVAQFNKENAEAGLVAVDSLHPFYQLDGKDNIIVIHSRYYNPFPLVIRGAGAGAEVTASGIFSDVITVINS